MRFSKFIAGENLNRGYSLILNSNLNLTTQLTHRDPRDYLDFYFEEKVKGEIEIPMDLQDSLVNRECVIITKGHTSEDTVLTSAYEVFKRLPYSTEGGLYPWGGRKDYIEEINFAQTSLSREKSISRVINEILERYVGNFMKVESQIYFRSGK